jgi:Flp pilus assembly protein TadD
VGINSPTNVNVTGGTTVNNTQIANNAFNAFNTANNFGRPWGAVNGGWYQGSLGGGWGALPSVWANGGFAGFPGYAGFAGSGYDAGVATAGAPAWAAPVAPTQTVIYSNPYYAAPADASTTTVESPTTVSTQLDYSQPIAVPTQAQEANADDDVVADGKKEFDQARTAFKGTLYRTALARVEAAIKLVPGDTTMHEFRALCLFALGRHKDAASGLYAVLSAGPGWNWDTMATLYADSNTYTKQLRRLEKYVKENAKDPRGHFLLGYHYAVLDERDAAAAEFGSAAELQPKDKLSASLAKALTAKPATTQQEAQEE